MEHGTQLHQQGFEGHLHHWLCQLWDPHLGDGFVQLLHQTLELLELERLLSLHMSTYLQSE